MYLLEKTWHLENLSPSVFLSALTAAAGSGRLAVCRLLLDQGAAVDQGNKQGVAPLFSAVRHDHWKVGRMQRMHTHKQTQIKQMF